jgi:hypothetical protein
MTTPVGWRLRGARAAIFAAVCVGLSAVGHVWMSGDGVPGWALALAFAALAATGYALAGRQRGFASIACLMLLGELGQHLLFTSAQNHAQDVAAIPEFVSGRVVPASAWICGMSHSGMGHDPGGAAMIVAHVVAGLVCAWWLRGGEVAVFRLLQTLGALAAPLLALLWPDTLVVPDYLRAPPPADDSHVARCNRLLSTVLARRGPPCSRIRII